MDKNVDYIYFDGVYYGRCRYIFKTYYTRPYSSIKFYIPPNLEYLISDNGQLYLAKLGIVKSKYDNSKSFTIISKGYINKTEKYHIIFDKDKLQLYNEYNYIDNGINDILFKIENEKNLAKFKMMFGVENGI